MKELTPIAGKFYHLWDDDKGIEYQVRVLGEGVFTNYQVSKYSSDYLSNSIIGDYDEAEFIKEFLK